MRELVVGGEAELRRKELIVDDEGCERWRHRPRRELLIRLLMAGAPVRLASGVLNLILAKIS